MFNYIKGTILYGSIYIGIPTLLYLGILPIWVGYIIGAIVILFLGYMYYLMIKTLINDLYEFAKN